MRIAQVSPLFESVPPATYGGARSGRLSDRRPGRSGPRRHAVCLRRLADGGGASACDAERAAPGSHVPGLAAAPHPPGGTGRAPGRRVRHSALSHGVSPHAPGPAPGAAVSDHAAWQARPAGSASPARRSPRCSAGLDLEQPTRTGAASELAWHGSSWAATPPAAVPGRAADDYLAFIGRISPEKRLDRAIAGGHQSRSASYALPPRSTRSIATTSPSAIEPCCRSARRGVLGEIGDAREGGPAREARGRSCFPSTGRSRSAWSSSRPCRAAPPVIAWRLGSVPELLERRRDRVHRGLEEGGRRCGRVACMRCKSLRDCRTAFERRFDAERLARDYVGDLRTAELRDAGRGCLGGDGAHDRSGVETARCRITSSRRASGEMPQPTW